MSRSVVRWCNSVAAPLMTAALSLFIWFSPLSQVSTDDVRYALSAVFQGMLALVGFEILVFSYALDGSRKSLQRLRAGRGSAALLRLTVVFVDTCMTAGLAAGVSLVALRGASGFSCWLLARLMWGTLVLAVAAIVRALLLLVDWVVTTQELTTSSGEEGP